MADASKRAPKRDRTLRNLGAFARAWGRRVATGLHQALIADPSKSTGRDEAEVAGAEELARQAAQLKGGLAKIAQLMAYQLGPGAATDAAARRALSALWSRAPAESAADVRAVIRADLGAEPEALFASWDDVPMAAASIGQVHAAVSREGERLAVKVQYPGVADALRADLESRAILKKLAGGDVGAALPPESIEALRQAVLGELDYVAEAESLERFGRAFAGDAEIVVPRVHRALSSARVLTMERLEGRPLDQVTGSRDAAERARVARAVFRFAFESPLRHGLLNADPNPGNYLVLADGDAPGSPRRARVGFLDFGCAPSTDPSVLEADRALFRAMLRRDGEALRYAVHRAGLLADPVALDSQSYRDWERLLAAPFLQRGPHAIAAEDVRELARLTGLLVEARGLAMPPGALLLWRQRLGALAVVAALRVRLDFRELLASAVEGPVEAERLLRTVYV